MDQQHTAGHARRRGDRLLGVEQDIGAFLRVDVGHLPRQPRLCFDLHNGVVAIDLRCCLGVTGDEAAATRTGQVVPHHFNAVLGDWEGIVVGLLEVLQRIAVVDRFGVQRADLGRIIDRLWHCRCTLALVHRDLVGIRVALEQGQLAGAQFVLVLFDVGRGDDELRLFTLERVADEVIADRGGAWFQATGPGRDAAVGVARFLSAQRRQRSAQLGRLFLGNSSQYTAGQQAQREGAYHQNTHLFHAVDPLPMVNQKFTPKLSATKSRSPLVLKSPPKKSV
ncbi:hypothetical protein D3C85_1142420 [compost metagenome]